MVCITQINSQIILKTYGIQGYMAGPGITVAPSIDTSSLLGATLKLFFLVGLQVWY